MSTLEREVRERTAPLPSTSTALVPLAGDGSPPGSIRIIPPKPVRVHLAFFGMWYAALAMLALATWIEPWSNDAMVSFFVIGGLTLGIGGLGILIYMTIHPASHKLRQALGAGAALALTIASLTPISNVAKEVYANGRIARLQGLVDELVRDGRVWELSAERSGWATLNGVTGQPATLAAELARPMVTPPPTPAGMRSASSVTQADIERYAALLRGAGMGRLERSGEVIVFTARNYGGPRLFYVLPGAVVPPRGTPLVETGSREPWLSTPLGGGWYVVD